MSSPWSEDFYTPVTEMDTNHILKKKEVRSRARVGSRRGTRQVDRRQEHGEDEGNDTRPDLTCVQRRVDRCEPPSHREHHHGCSFSAHPPGLKRWTSSLPSSLHACLDQDILQDLTWPYVTTPQGRTDVLFCIGM